MDNSQFGKRERLRISGGNTRRGFYQKNLAKLHGMRLIVFGVWLTYLADNAAFQVLLDQNFKPEQQWEIHLFHFPGALYYAKMAFHQKCMMELLVKKFGRFQQRTRLRFRRILSEVTEME